MQCALHDAVLHPPLRQRVRFMGARVIEAEHAGFAEEYRHRGGGVEPEALIGNQVSQPACPHPARCRRWIAHRNTLMLGARTVACSSTILRSAMRKPYGPSSGTSTSNLSPTNQSWCRSSRLR